MKIFLLTITLFSMHFFSFGQAVDSIAKQAIDTVAHKDCYAEFKAAFVDKNVYPLKDGLYNTVITIRHNDSCAIYDGRAKIASGKFSLPLYIKDENGKFIPIKDTGRKLNKNYDAYRIPLENKIVKGCSPTYISDRDELIDIFLIDLTKPTDK